MLVCGRFSLQTAQLGVGCFSTPWTRYPLNTDERTQKLEGNMENEALENSVTSNLENLVPYLELSLVVRFRYTQRNSRLEPNLCCNARCAPLHARLSRKCRVLACALV